MYPHDYHDHHGDPHMHNNGEGRLYIEPDYHANLHKAQLPSLSAIGRGPRGEGLKVGNVVDEQGTVSFALYSDLTGELVWQSPNLDPGEIRFVPIDFRDTVPGQAAPLDIIYEKGGVTKTTTAYLPAGDRGSLVYLLEGFTPRNNTDVYQTTVGELSIYGLHAWAYGNKPTPRVNDIVFFSYRQTDQYSPTTPPPGRDDPAYYDWITQNTEGMLGIAFGTIEAVGNANNQTIDEHTPVVFTARVYVPCYSEIAEQERIANENERKANETVRIDNERTRVSNEETRVRNEETRVNNENIRVRAEQGRVEAEAGRVAAEEYRVREFNDMIARNKSYDAVFVTTEQNTPTITIPITDWRKYNLLFVYIEGLFLSEGTDYTVNEMAGTITLATPITHVGTHVQFRVVNYKNEE